MRAVRNSVRWTALIGVSPGVMLRSVHAKCGSLQTARTVLINCRSSVTWDPRTPVAPGVSVASVKLPRPLLSAGGPAEASERLDPCLKRGVRRRAGLREVHPEPLEGQLRQALRERSGQRVGVEIQASEVGQVAQPCRDRSAQPVPAEVQIGEVGEIAYPRRDRAAQVEIVEIQRPESGHFSQPLQWTCQVVAAQTEAAKIRQPLQFARNRPVQRVVVEIQGSEVGEAGQFGRDRPAQLVAPERQELEVGEAGQFGRDRPAQLVAPRATGIGGWRGRASSGGIGPLSALAQSDRVWRLTRVPSSAQPPIPVSRRQ